MERSDDSNPLPALPFRGTPEEVEAVLERCLLMFVDSGEIGKKRINVFATVGESGRQVVSRSTVREYLEQNPDKFSPEARVKILEALP